MSEVSRHHFVEVKVPHDSKPTIRFGYAIFRRRYYVLQFPSSTVSSVDWVTGQASGVAGQDMDDWHVTIWYHDADRPKEKLFPWVRDEHLHIVTGMASRCKVEPFGMAFVAFLQDGAGAKLKPTNNSTEFTSTGKSINNEVGRKCKEYFDSERKGLT